MYRRKSYVEPTDIFIYSLGGSEMAYTFEHRPNLNILGFCFIVDGLLHILSLLSYAPLLDL